MTICRRGATGDDGAEALERAREANRDLIRMDIQMPRGRPRAGADAALAATPVIAITALAMAGNCEWCLAAGIGGYPAKPVNLPELRRTTERLMAARRSHKKRRHPSPKPAFQ